MLIWLDVPLPKRLWRVVWRTLRDYGHSRADLPENCPEQFDPEFFRWIWDTRHTGRANMKELFDGAPSELPAHRLVTNKDVDAFCNSSQ